MSSYKYLMYGIIFLALIGFVFPFILGYFVDYSDIKVSPSINSTINFMGGNQTFTVLTKEINVNPFFWVPDTIMNHIIDSLKFLSIFPPIVITGVILIFTMSLVIALLALIRGN